MQIDLWKICLCALPLGLLVGCASTRPADPLHLAPGQTVFEPIGTIDFRSDSREDYRRLVRPGDLIVTYMRLGRVVKKREWLFAVLPHGHAMIVLDPDDPLGILECRFHGTRRVGPEELDLYSYSIVYRLRDPQRLNLDRLREFADAACERCRAYSFKSWLGRNDNLLPDRPEAISPQYTCSTMVAAAYHYAGLTLEVTQQDRRVLTPLSISGSLGAYNAFALSPDDAAACGERFAAWAEPHRGPRAPESVAGASDERSSR